MADARKSFNSLGHTSGELYFFTNDFTDQVAEIVMADPRAKVFDQYRLQLIAYRNIDAERLSEFLFQFAQHEPELFYSNIVKSIHDELNHATAKAKHGGGVPITVENTRGDHWDLAGDTTLSESPETLNIIKQAIAQSEANLEVATTISAPGSLLDLDSAFENQIPELLEKVWDFTPRPTVTTQRHMDTVRHAATDTSNRAAVSRFADGILDHLPEVIDGLEKRGVLKSKADLHKEAQEMMVGM